MQTFVVHFLNVWVFLIYLCFDRFSTFSFTFSLQNIRATTVIVGINSFVGIFGQIQTLRVDNGVQWTSKVFQDYVKYLGCDLCISSMRYPESNGLAERAIKSIKVALTAKLDRDNWTFHLGAIVRSSNIIYRNELECSPSDLMFFQPYNCLEFFLQKPHLLPYHLHQSFWCRCSNLLLYSNLLQLE